MSRLPPYAKLDTMPAQERHGVLMIAQEARYELEGLLSGHISVERKPKWQAVANARRRLKRVYDVADGFGDFVGQPDRMRVRVRALARPIVAN